MARRRSRDRGRRAQKIIAVVLLVTMVMSGLAFYAAASITGTQQPAQQPTQQGR